MRTLISATRVDADEATALDSYAAENPAEFFAVMSEAFFQTPQVVRSHYPAVYEQLALFYRQDPRGDWARNDGLFYQW